MGESAWRWENLTRRIQRRFSRRLDFRQRAQNSSWLRRFGFYFRFRLIGDCSALALFVCDIPRR